MSATDETEREEVSRSDELIEKIKRNRVVAGQFRVKTLLVVIVALSVALALPRFVGWEYEHYFGFLWICAFAFAPLLAFTAAAITPRLDFVYRIIVAGVCAALTVVPMVITLAATGSGADLLEAIIGVGLLFWLPQVVIIWLVWRFLFRNATW